MKKFLIISTTVCVLLMISACGGTTAKNIGVNKYEIVSKKYSEVDYIVEGILLHQKVSQDFGHIEGIDYIVKNSGNRGSVDPLFRNNFFLMVDIVKQGEDYKLLIYNNLMKRMANKKKMFVLADYFLAISIDSIISTLKTFDMEDNLLKYDVSITKNNGSSYETWITNDEVTIAFYNQATDNALILTLYDHINQMVLATSTNDMWLVDIKNKQVYLPTDMTYQQLIK